MREIVRQIIFFQQKNVFFPFSTEIWTSKFIYLIHSILFVLSVGRERERQGERQERRIRSTKRGAINRARNVIVKSYTHPRIPFPNIRKVFFFGEIKMNDVVKNHKEFKDLLLCNPNSTILFHFLLFHRHFQYSRTPITHTFNSIEWVNSNEKRRKKVKR